MLLERTAPAHCSCLPDCSVTDFHQRMQCSAHTAAVPFGTDTRFPCSLPQSFFLRCGITKFLYIQFRMPVSGSFLPYTAHSRIVSIKLFPETVNIVICPIIRVRGISYRDGGGADASVSWGKAAEVPSFSFPFGQDNRFFSPIFLTFRHNITNRLQVSCHL